MAKPGKFIRFLHDFGEFKKDEVKSIELSYADKWIRLGHAVDSDAPDDGGNKTVLETPGPKYDASIAIANDWVKGRAADLVALAGRLGAKGVKGAQQAAAAIVEALFERGQPIELRSEQVEEVRTVSVLKPWPAYTRFAREFLAQPEGMEGLEVKGSEITITLSNGMAVYHIVAEREHEVVAALGDQAFEEPKPADGAAS